MSRKYHKFITPETRESGLNPSPANVCRTHPAGIRETKLADAVE